MKKLKILTRHDISSAYSCLQYLAEELKHNYEVEIWSNTDKSRFSFLKNPAINRTFRDSWYGNIKKIRVIFVFIHAFFVLLKDKGDFIINDVDFFPLGYLVKKLYPKRKFIMYFTEINGPDIKTFRWIERFYAKYANTPDMTIECLRERAEYRARQFGIKNKVYFINNTISKTEIVDSEKMRVNKEHYIPNSFEGKVIVFYAGGCNLSRDLGTFIREISRVKEVCFLAFCYGTEEEMQNVRNMCEKYFQEGSYVVHEAVPRQLLLKVMSYVDIGIVYYEPTFSDNHRYAAPSKFFEYMAKGLNIISSNNEGINHIIHTDTLGVCIQDNETIAMALVRLLEQGLKKKEDVVAVFEQKYAYEVDSKKAIQKLTEIIGE